MTRILSPVDVRTLLPMGVCIDLMTDAFQALNSEGTINPLRRGMLLPERRGILGMMPGYVDAPPTLGLKVVAVFPGNHGTKYDSHQGVVVLFDTANGVPVGILDASEITAIRTAAATAVATNLLANRPAPELAIIGTGVQARTHLEAMCIVRPPKRVRVFSRDPVRRLRFAEHESRRHNVPVESVDTAHAAVSDADIICTTTSAREPVLFGDWLKPGAHVNAVGSSIKQTREIDTEAVRRSRVYVDRRESTLNESGDFLMALEEGAIEATHIVAEIGEVLGDTGLGRQTPDEITMFISLGLAAEDLVAAQYVLRMAASQNVGVTVDLGGVIDDHR